MNYYGLWISFDDSSTLFYNPKIRELEYFFRNGTPMPSDFFFTRDDLSIHKDRVEHLAARNCLGHLAKLHLSEIRPQDPDWDRIHMERSL